MVRDPHSDPCMRAWARGAGDQQEQELARQPTRVTTNTQEQEVVTQRRTKKKRARGRHPKTTFPRGTLTTLIQVDEGDLLGRGFQGGGRGTQSMNSNQRYIGGGLACLGRGFQLASNTVQPDSRHQARRCRCHQRSPPPPPPPTHTKQHIYKTTHSTPVRLKPACDIELEMRLASGSRRAKTSNCQPNRRVDPGSCVRV